MKKIFSIFFLAIISGCMLLASPAIAFDYPPRLNVGGFVVAPQAYSFRAYSFCETVEKAKEVGCNAVEAMEGQPLVATEDTPLSYKASPRVWAKAKMKLEETGVQIVNYYFHKLPSDEAEARKVFDFLKIMDIPAITSEPDENALDMIEKLVKEYDIRLCIHNHPNWGRNPDYKYWNPNHVLECVKGRDRRVGVCADVGHWVRSGINATHALRVLEGRILSCHLKDVPEFGVLDSEDVVLGEGVVNIEAILDELNRQGFKGTLTIEYEKDPEYNQEQVAQCVEFVREYGEKHFE